jgi:aminocarboxymuconate-semialdehyde decarboxylase
VRDPWFQKFSLWNSVGQPIEEARVPDSMVNISQAPSAYLRRLYYETCVYEPSTLSALIGQVGADHVLMGSDWPVGEADPIGFVERCEALDEAGRRAVLGASAARLLGIDET